MIKVAMLSKWHVHAEGMAKDILKLGHTITCVWDEDAERGRDWAKQLNVDFVQDLDECLSRDDVDAVICYAPTTIHKEVLIKAAKAKKHIFTEKALAPTVIECEEIATEIRKSGVKFLISLPQRTSGIVLYTKKLIDEGTLGKISLIRIRNGHDGTSGGWLPEYWYEEKDAAGGAMMDLGCHPMYTLSYLLGKPKKISSLFSNICDKPVDDSAICLIEFENGVAGLAETSFVVYNAPSSYEVYGTEGTLMVINGKVMMNLKSLNGATKKMFEVTELPANLAPPIELFFNSIKNDTEPEFNLDAAIALTELLENAYIAQKGNTVVEIN